MLLPLFGAPNYLLTPSYLFPRASYCFRLNFNIGFIGILKFEIGLFVAKRDQIIYSTFAKSSVMSPIVISMPTRELLAGETKNSFVYRFEHFNNKNIFCK